MKVTRSAASRNSPAAPLAQILREKVLPWAQQCNDRCFCACDPDHGAWPEPGRAVGKPLRKGAPPEYLTPCTPRGRRVSVKTGSGDQDVAVSSQITAMWPQEGLQSSRAPYIACVLQGTVELRIGDFLFEGHAGDFLFVPPDVPMDDGTRPHFVGPASAGRHCAILWISAARTGLGCWICHSQDERHFTEPEQSCYVLHPHSVQLFQTLMHEIGADGAPRKSALRKNPSPKSTEPLAAIGRPLFIALLHILCREIEAGRILQFAHQKLDERHLEDRRDPIGRAQEYIRSHLHEPLSINQVARLCFLSRSQFTRRFREETGSSFAEFLIEARLIEARRLLHETDWSVERVCVLVGLHSSRLRALFRERGLPSPRTFRQTPETVVAAPQNPVIKKPKHG